MIPNLKKKILQELVYFQVSTSLIRLDPLLVTFPWSIHSPVLTEDQRLSLSLASFLDFDWDSSFSMLLVPAALGYDLEWEDCWRLNRSALVPAKDSSPLSVKDLQLFDLSYQDHQINRSFHSWWHQLEQVEMRTCSLPSPSVISV